MPVDSVAYAEMAQIDVSIIRPFLQGTEQYAESQLADEVFALKPLVDTLGSVEVRSVVTKLAAANRHGEIIPTLQEKIAAARSAAEAAETARAVEAAEAAEATEAAKAKKVGVFGWLFKGKEKERSSDKAAEKEKERERQLEMEREREREKEREQELERGRGRERKKDRKANSSEPRQRKHTHSPQLSNAGASWRGGVGVSETASEPKLAIGSYAVEPEVTAEAPTLATPADPTPAPPPPVAAGPGLPFNPRYSQSEVAMMTNYNFHSETSRTVSVEGSAQPSTTTRQDDDFDAIFRQFLQKSSQ